MVETVKTAKELCRHYMEQGTPCYTIGPPGVGKSEMWAQIADEKKIGFIDVRLAQMDPVDLRGLPGIIEVKGKAVSMWARPDFWPDPDRDGDEGIILFDELGDCNKAMQSAAYQPILNGRVGPHILPKGWYRAGAGNDQKHRAGAQPMSTALANRFAHVEIESDIDCWREWAARNNVSPIVIGFLKFRPKLLHSMPEGGAVRAFPSPRSWYQAAKYAGTDKQVRLKLIAGCVGDGAAGEFEAFLRSIDLPELEEVCANPKKCRVPEAPAHKYAMSAMLAQGATRQNFDKIMVYISRSEFGRDFEICTVLDASKRDTTLTETKAFTDFANRNQDLTL